MSTKGVLQNHHRWRFIDQSRTDSSFAALYSFAIDDTLCTSVGMGSSAPIIRTWIHHHDFVMGSRDARLSNVDKGIRFLQEKGYRTVVRNSGGAAVALDSGVLNLTLILPAPDWASNIQAGFEAMVELVRMILKPIGADFDVQEIQGSYCPGDFDLSIGGRKFAGLAQRRRKGAVAVQAFLLVEGEAAARAQLVKEFYQAAAGSPQDIYPQVEETTVASLSEALDQAITCSWMVERLRQLVGETADNVVDTQLLPEELAEFNDNVQRMRARNPHLANLEQ